jgi:hypothetical protein
MSSSMRGSSSLSEIIVEPTGETRIWRSPKGFAVLTDEARLIVLTTGQSAQHEWATLIEPLCTNQWCRIAADFESRAMISSPRLRSPATRRGMARKCVPLPTTKTQRYALALASLPACGMPDQTQARVRLIDCLLSESNICIQHLWAMAWKRTLVATTDKQVFTSAQSREQQARWLALADTALHNEQQRGQEMNPGNRARQEHQRVNGEVRDVLKNVA